MTALYSMTGFARAQSQGDCGLVTCELRSINHRYLDISLHVPDVLRELESTLRDQIRHHIKRGKIECYIRYQSSDAAGAEMKVNMHMAKQLCDVSEKISQLLKNPAPVNTIEMMRWPGILQIEELDLEKIEDELTKVMEKALIDLVDMRVREGEVLRKVFFQRLDTMQEELVKVKGRMPEIIAGQREKLMARFSEAKIELDPARLEQEMVMLAQRIDVMEEMDRLSAHMNETQRILKQGGMIGRRLDFLMQELHREANTLGSKSAHVDSTRASVELKVLIEQMREQVQNIE